MVSWDGGAAFILEEYGGINLKEYFKNCPMNEPEIVVIALQLVRGLEEIHEKRRTLFTRVLSPAPSLSILKSRNQKSDPYAAKLCRWISIFRTGIVGVPG